MSEHSYRLIRSSSNLDNAQYLSFLRQADAASIYHHPGWIRSIEEGLGKDAEHLLVEKDGNPVGILPGFHADIRDTRFSRLVSVSPGRGGPALSGNWELVLNRLFDALEDERTRTTLVHTIRSDINEHLALNGYLSERGYTATLGGKFVLPVRGEWEGILDGMHKDRRYNIRKGHKIDHNIVEHDLGDILDEFYSDYCVKLDELGNDPLPKSFFECLAKYLSKQIVVLANHADGETRGYHLYLLDEYQQTIRHYLMTVTRDDFQYYSGELLHESMIKRGLDGEWKAYDFGGRDIDFREGGFQFKKQFGGSLCPEYRWEREFSTAFGLARTAFN